jgi:hypothetical protein
MNEFTEVEKLNHINQINKDNFIDEILNSVKPEELEFPFDRNKIQNILNDIEKIKKQNNKNKKKVKNMNINNTYAKSREYEIYSDSDYKYKSFKSAKINKINNKTIQNKSLRINLRNENKRYFSYNSNDSAAVLKFSKSFNYKNNSNNLTKINNKSKSKSKLKVLQINIKDIMKDIIKDTKNKTIEIEDNFKNKEDKYKDLLLELKPDKPVTSTQMEYYINKSFDLKQTKCDKKLTRRNKNITDLNSRTPLSSRSSKNRTLSFFSTPHNNKSIHQNKNNNSNVSPINHERSSSMPNAKLNKFLNLKDNQIYKSSMKFSYLWELINIFEKRKEFLSKLSIF